jgi:hypothetical protein
LSIWLNKYPKHTPPAPTHTTHSEEYVVPICWGCCYDLEVTMRTDTRTQYYERFLVKIAILFINDYNQKSITIPIAKSYFVVVSLC